MLGRGECVYPQQSLVGVCVYELAGASGLVGYLRMADGPPGAVAKHCGAYGE